MANISQANLTKAVKVLGKWCKLYDQTIAGDSALQTLVANTAEQIADQASYTLDAQMVNYISAALSGATQTGNESTNAKAAARVYILGTLAGYIVAVPAAQTEAAILDALNTDCIAGGFYFDALTSTGLLNFLTVVAGAEITLPTAGATLFADAVYVVSAVV